MGLPSRASWRTVSCGEDPVKKAMAVLLALAACGGDESQDGPCPTIACLLSISVSNPPAEPYRVEATAAGQTTAQVRDCATGGSCFIGFSSDLFPGQLTVRVVLTASGTVERTATVTPNYHTVPIPVHCGGPTCSHGGITI
jgi:hypothetical protein